jgi:hypothetical protein
VKCRHCGKRIKSFNNYRGEEDWTHEDQVTGMWCRLKAAEPEDVPPDLVTIADNG